MGWQPGAVVGSPSGTAVLLPSGDTSGATDYAAISALLAAGKEVLLGFGTYYLSQTLSIPAGGKLLGIGKGLSIVMRAGSFGTVISPAGDNVICEGFTLDGGLSQFPTNANHGISAQNVNGFRARKMFFQNWQNSAVLIQGTPAQTYRDCKIEECVCDGAGGANNGFLIVNMDESGMSTCTGRNVTGSPGYACQLKNNCRWSYIDNCVGVLSAGGLVFGRDSAPGCQSCRITSGTAYGCDGGVLAGDATDCVIDGVTIYMTTNVNDSIRFQQGCTNNVATGVVVHGTGASRSVVRFDDTSTDNVVTLDLVDAAAATTAAFTVSADRNLVEVKKYGTSKPTHELSTSSTGVANRLRRVEDRRTLYDAGLGAVVQTMDRNSPTAALVMSPNLPYYLPVYLEAGEVISNVTIHVSAFTTQPTSYFVGLYLASTGALVASSADQHALVTATGQVTAPLSAAYTVLDSGIYYVALLQVGGVFSPLGLAGSTASRLGSNPYPYAQDTNAAATVLPSPNLSIAAGTKAMWAELS